MSGSYWGVSDKIQINQTDIEIKCEGQDQFQENQVIGIYIPPSVKFFSGKDCTLDFDVLINNDSAMKTRLCLDATTGAQSLFSKCVVYAGNRQTVLETLNDYNSWVSVKYSYDTNDAIRSRRALTEGCGEHTSASRGDVGTSKSIQNNFVFSQYQEQANKGADPTDTLTEEAPFTKASVSLPIHMGVFANSTKAFPNILTDGCYLELTCASNQRVMRMMDGVCNNRRLCLNAMFGSLDGKGGTWNAGSGQNAFYTMAYNNSSNPQHSAFSVGESLSFVRLVDGVVAVMSVPLIITSIEDGNAPNEPVKINFTTPCSPNINITQDAGNNNPNFAIISLAGNDNTLLPEYTLSNVRLKVRQLDIAEYEKGMVGKMKNGGTVQFDIPSVACGLRSANQTDWMATIPIPCEHAKARSIICMPTDASVYTISEQMDSNHTYKIDDLEFNPFSTAEGIHKFSDRTGISGIGDYLSYYSFNIDGKIVPSRRIDTNLTSGKTKGLNQGHLIELEKSLQQSHNTPPRSFVDFRNNFLIGRALTLDENTIYDGRGRDIQLNLAYQEQGNAPDKPKLWKCFVSHIKTVSIKGDSVNVQN